MQTHWLKLDMGAEFKSSAVRHTMRQTDRVFNFNIKTCHNSNQSGKTQPLEIWCTKQEQLLGEDIYGADSDSWMTTCYAVGCVRFEGYSRSSGSLNFSNQLLFLYKVRWFLKIEHPIVLWLWVIYMTSRPGACPTLREQQLPPPSSSVGLNVALAGTTFKHQYFLLIHSLLILDVCFRWLSSRRSHDLWLRRGSLTPGSVFPPQLLHNLVPFTDSRHPLPAEQPPNLTEPPRLSAGMLFFPFKAFIVHWLWT